MIICEKRVGRLIEQRFIDPVTLDDIAEFTKQVKELLAAAKEPAVVCTDLRPTKIFATTVAKAMIDIMRGTSPRVFRSAILVSEHGVFFNSQMERIIAESGNASRRTFKEVTPLLVWLKPELTEQEYAGAVAFYANRSHRGHSPLESVLGKSKHT